jgi:hypothetical protein
LGTSSDSPATEANRRIPVNFMVTFFNEFKITSVAGRGNRG